MTEKFYRAVRGLRMQAENIRRKGWVKAVSFRDTGMGREKVIDQNWWQANDLLNEMIEIMKIYERKLQTADYTRLGLLDKPSPKKWIRKTSKK